MKNNFPTSTSKRMSWYLLLTTVFLGAWQQVLSQTTHTWNPANSNLSNFISSAAWTSSGNHIIEIGAGTFSGTQLGDWSGQITWETMGTRQASSITIRGTGRTGTVIQASGSNLQNGVNRVNATNMSGITFEDLTFEVISNASLFGQWQNGPTAPANVTFRNTNVILQGTGALIGRTNWNNLPAGDPNRSGQLIFDNSNVVTQSNRVMAQWDWNAGRPLPGMVNGSGNSYFYSGSISDANFDGNWNTSKYFNVGAFNGPNGAGDVYNNDATNGGFITGFRTSLPLVITPTVTNACGDEFGGSIGVSFTGGTGPFNISWTGGSATGITSPYTISGLSAGTYSVTIIDGNLSSETVSSLSVQGAYLTSHPSPISRKTTTGIILPVLSVAANSGSATGYQWYSNTTATNSGGTIINGATSETFQPPTNAGGILYYYCVVNTTSGCTLTSRPSGFIQVCP